MAEEQALFSGDQVMGWSTTVVGPPDGDMAAYMASLDRLLARGDKIYWPTHGGPIRDPRAHVAELIAHRRTRRAAILEALSAGPSRPADIVVKVYRGLDPRLVEAAAESVRAHLIELAAAGLAVEKAGLWRRLQAGSGM